MLDANPNVEVSLTASGAGVLELGIGVLDSPRSDTAVTSTITASNFDIPNNPGPGPGPGPGVPAPMTLALFGLGLVSMGASRRRKAA